MNIKGKIHSIGETVQVSEKFKKRQVIIEYAENPTYPEFINFELQQEKTDLVSNLKKGQMVDVEFNLRGREWINPKDEKVYFNTLVIWRIKEIGISQQNSTRPPGAQNLTVNAGVSLEDDLPF